MALTQLRFLCLALLIVFGVRSFQAEASRKLSKNSMSEIHERWMSRHGRVYKNAAEKQHRLSIFKSNLELIESVNAGNHKFKLGANQFADLTNDEFKEICSGFHPMLMTTVEAAKGFMYENVTEAPLSVDWRAKGAVTPKLKFDFKLR